MRLVLIIWLLCAARLLSAQTAVETFDFDQLKGHIGSAGDTVHVVNFWATWCKPCVAELPYFEELSETTVDVPLKVTLVSLDFQHQVESKLIPFIQSRQLQNKVLHLYERNPNDWIDLVSPDWSGAIPATLFIHGDEERFHEGEFASKQDILDIINSLYNSKS